MANLNELSDRIRTFSDDRDWADSHDPKSLLLAITGEVGSLAKVFQWLPTDQAQELATATDLRDRCRDELGDVLIYLTRLADVLGVDLVDAAAARMDSAERHFTTA